MDGLSKSLNTSNYDFYLKGRNYRKQDKIMNKLLGSTASLNPLDILFQSNKCDKAQHGYTKHYYTLFDKLIGQNRRFKNFNLSEFKPSLNILEVGVWNGNSLKAWSDYLKVSEQVDFNIRIFGIDLFERTSIDQVFENINYDPNITLFQCDSTNSRQVKEIFEDSNIRFDLIIDDGSHFPIDQLKTFENLIPYLRMAHDLNPEINENVASQSWGISQYHGSKETYSYNSYYVIEDIWDLNNIMSFNSPWIFKHKEHFTYQKYEKFYSQVKTQCEIRGLHFAEKYNCANKPENVPNDDNMFILNGQYV